MNRFDANGSAVLETDDGTGWLRDFGAGRAYNEPKYVVTTLRLNNDFLQSALNLRRIKSSRMRDQNVVQGGALVLHGKTAA